MSNEDRISRQEAGEILGFSPQWISIAVKNGLLAAKKLNPLLVSRIEVERLYEKLDFHLLVEINEKQKSRKKK